MKNQKILKQITNWQILFASTAHSKINFGLAVLFAVNYFLNIIVVFKYLLRRNASIELNLLAAFTWGIATFIHLFRCFYNKNIPVFVKVIPAAKKLYVNTISLITELINTLMLIFVFAGCIIVFYKGCSSTKLYIVLTLACIAHFIISAVLPAASILLQKEGTPNFWQIESIRKNQILLIVLILLAILPFAIIIPFTDEISLRLGDFSTESFSLLLFICAVWIALSCIINRIVLLKLYKM